MNKPSLKDLFALQKQAKALKKIHIESESNGVIVIMNAKQEIIEIKIPDELLTNKKKLEKSITESMQKALKKSQEVAANEMKDLMKGFNLPGM